MDVETGHPRLEQDWLSEDRPSAAGFADQRIAAGVMPGLGARGIEADHNIPLRIDRKRGEEEGQFGVVDEALLKNGVVNGADAQPVNDAAPGAVVHRVQDEPKLPVLEHRCILNGGISHVYWVSLGIR